MRSSCVDASSQFILENDHVQLIINEYGRLDALLNKITGHNHAGGTPLWRLYVQEKNEMDVELAAEDVQPFITHDDERLTLRYSSIQYKGLPANIAICIEVYLRESDVHWQILIENNQPELVIRECHFPLLGGLNERVTPGLITSENGGERINDLRQELQKRETGYMAPDHLFTLFSIGYPYPAATNCFVLTGSEEANISSPGSMTGGLYFGCHTWPVERTLHQFRLYPAHHEQEDPAKTHGIEAGFVRFPNLATGQTWECGPFVISPYSGSWHTAARKYRSWAGNWFDKNKLTPPGWLRRSNGWQRIIMQHQYGTFHYNFDDLPVIHKDGMESGINALFMFGWHRGGHDNNYPDYEPDPGLGGETQLRRKIAQFGAHGGHVLLYANGRLIDTTSTFYRKTGHRISIKDLFGQEIREAYKFRGPGNFVSECATRSFAVACPSCAEWFDVLRALAEKAVAWGCHSLFLDQAGMNEYPCCDASHGHGPLWSGAMMAKADTLRRLRDLLRAARPEMALGIEWLNDVTAQYADYVHSITGGCSVTNPDWLERAQRPRSRSFIEWFRYTFPEVILSDREIRDDRDVERRVNHAVLKGLRSDVEIYRCRKTIASAPRYASWLAQVNKLRQTHADLLLEGVYVDTEYFCVDNSEVDARAFCDGDNIHAKAMPRQLAVVLAQSHLALAATHVTAPGYRIVRWDAVGAATAVIPPDSLCASLTLPRHSLIITRWELTD